MDDLLGNDIECYLEILGLLHWIFQVEVLHIYNEALLI